MVPARWGRRATERRRGLAALEFHIPELVPVYRELCTQVAGDDPLAARIFTFLRPSPSIFGCSQGVWREGEAGPLLVRDYDYPAELMDGVILLTSFLGRTVAGTADGVWGRCDGMNDRGFAVSLTFGGRVVVGDGFGMPLVIRYLLETCGSVSEAKGIFARFAVLAGVQPDDDGCRGPRGDGLSRARPPTGGCRWPRTINGSSRRGTHSLPPAV